MGIYARESLAPAPKSHLRAQRRVVLTAIGLAVSEMLSHQILHPESLAHTKPGGFVADTVARAVVLADLSLYARD